MASSVAACGLAAGSSSLDVAQREPDRDQPLLRPVVEVALEPAALLVAGRDDPRPRVLDLGELAAHLDPQPGDLDRQPGRADDALEQVGALAQRRVVHDGRERERPRAAPACARGRPPGRLDHAARSHRRRPRRREPEEQLQPGIAERLCQHAPVASGAARPCAQVLEEALDLRSPS